MFDISELLIQYHTDSCCKHITGGVYKNIFMSRSIGPCVCCVCMMCDIKLECYQTPCHLCQTCGKVEAFLHEAHSKVLLVLNYKAQRVQICHTIK